MKLLLSEMGQCILLAIIMLELIGAFEQILESVGEMDVILLGTLTGG